MPSRNKTAKSADYALSDPIKAVQTSASGKVKVAVTDIDGENLRRAVGQQTVGKAPGGRADVKRSFVFDLNGELDERLFELDAAAADIGSRRL